MTTEDGLIGPQPEVSKSHEKTYFSIEQWEEVLRDAPNDHREDEDALHGMSVLKELLRLYKKLRELEVALPELPEPGNNCYDEFCKIALIVKEGWKKNSPSKSAGSIYVNAQDVLSDIKHLIPAEQTIFFLGKNLPALETNK